MLMRILFTSVVCVVAFPISIWGQGAVSSMSVGAARAGISNVGPNGSYRMPLPEFIRIEEFINYHRHELPLPADDQRVHLDVQRMAVDKGRTVFQFGITTPRALDPDKMPPLNVVLVIDRSGSMSGDRVAKVRESLRAFVEQFRKTDKVSIVGFGNQAKVDLDAGQKTKLNKITKAIDSLEANYGGTNLHAGLMLGYEQALKHFDPERTNRVIFLTDGNANVGVTQSEEIAKQSRACNKKGISLTTIGLGVDFNHGLLRQLAESGLGTIHYVGDSKDIKKIFVAEVDALLAPAARNVRLAINFGNSTKNVKFYGYDPVRKNNEYVFKLDDLNHGATQVVMARLAKGDVDASAKVSLRYVDLISHKKVEIVKDLAEMVAHDGNLDSINRNYAIALVAKALHSAAVSSNKDQCQKAADRLAKGIRQAKERVKNDKHVNRIVGIAKDYEGRIIECIRTGRGD